MPPDNIPNDTTPTFRLTDMEVKEVSTVDRAANKRKFLVVKRSEAMPAGHEVVANADGTLTITPPAVAAPAAAPAAVVPEVEEGVATAKADVSLTQDAKDTLSKVLEEVIAQLTETKDNVDAATVVEDPAETSAEPVSQMMMDCAEALEDTVYALLGEEEPPEADTTNVTAPADGAATPAPSTSGEAGPPVPPMSKRLVVLTAKRILRNADLAKSCTTLVQKYGSKMKKERLARFRQAFQLLGGVLNELGLEQAEANAADVQKNAVAKRDELAKALTDQRAQHAAAIAKMQADNKALAEQVGAARNARGESNAVNVDGDKTRVRKDGSFNWPLDMNAPLGRNDVAKGDTFGDDE